jgi:hypothetical protein
MQPGPPVFLQLMPATVWLSLPAEVQLRTGGRLVRQMPKLLGGMPPT